MRFSDLQGLSGLPIEHVERRFRNEDVITVLPAHTLSGRETMLVATPTKLAVVASTALPNGHWMTWWAPWDLVAIADDEASDDGWFGLTLNVGRLVLEARLPGLDGQRALRDFVVAIRTRRSALAAPAVGAMLAR